MMQKIRDLPEFVTLGENMVIAYVDNASWRYVNYRENFQRVLDAWRKDTGFTKSIAVVPVRLDDRVENFPPTWKLWAWICSFCSLLIGIFLGSML